MIEGVSRMKKDKDTHYAKYVKTWCKVHGVGVLPDVKIRRRRRKETKPRRPKQMLEKKMEKEILLYVNSFPHMVGAKLGDMPGTYTYNAHFMLAGITDLLVINLKKKKFTWVECKIGRNTLSDKQKEFQSICLTCGQEHLVVWKKSGIFHLI